MSGVMIQGIYDSAEARMSALGELRELARYRDLLALLVARNIKTRYKRSVLGVAWTMVNPLLTMVVLTLVFSNLFRASIRHYPVYLLSGLLIWNFMAQTTTAAVNEMVWNSGLLRRVYVPRAIFAVAATGTGLVNLALALVPLFAIALATGLSLRPALMFLPVAVLLAAAFSLGLGLCLSTLAVFYADVIDMYQILLMAWMYLTPVLYPADILPPAVAGWLRLNPMAYLVECFRAPIYAGQWPSTGAVLGATVAAVGSLAVGGWQFARKSNELAYRI